MHCKMVLALDCLSKMDAISYLDVPWFVDRSVSALLRVVVKQRLSIPSSICSILLAGEFRFLVVKFYFSTFEFL